MSQAALHEKHTQTLGGSALSVKDAAGEQRTGVGNDCETPSPQEVRKPTPVEEEEEDAIAEQLPHDMNRPAPKNFDDCRDMLSPATFEEEHDGCCEPATNDDVPADAEALERDRRLSDEITSLGLNPLAQEFRPPASCSHGIGSSSQHHAGQYEAQLGGYAAAGPPHYYYDSPGTRHCSSADSTSTMSSYASSSQHPARRRRGKNRQSVNIDSVRRTVYVCDIESSVTEEQLASLFIRCGQVIDCRICGDPNSALRFAFVEFTTEAAAMAALMLHGAVLNYQQLQVLPSKTPIMPVNPIYLPQSQNELETCGRTIYVTNIDQTVEKKQLTAFFEQACGSISKSRVLGQMDQSTKIAFIEFALAESAMSALNCSGAILGRFPIRVSPSKTPVRLKKARADRSSSGSRSRSHSLSSDST